MRLGPSFFLLGIAVAFAQTPTVNSNGVVNAASFDAPVAPGSLVAIFGANLAQQPVQATVIPLPGSLAGTSVRFNGMLAPLLFVSSGQINAQLPWEISGAGSVSVVVNNNGASSAPQSVAVGAFQPGVFALQGYAVAVHLDGSLAAPPGAIAQYPSRPAMPGETLIVYATGLGAVNPPATTGNNSLDATRTTTVTPIVSFGPVPGKVAFSGLSPQFVGVYQLNVVVPDNPPAGDSVPIQIQIGGITSSTQAKVAVGAESWSQWGANPQHTSAPGVAGQDLNRILADIVYDPLAPAAQAATGDLIVHYQVPLVSGNDVFMEFKGGVYDRMNFASQIWGERKYSWQGDQLLQSWSYTSDWKAPGSLQDFFEPVYHAVLANGAVYVPGASGSIVQLDAGTGAVVRRIAPFQTDPNTFETGPISADSHGNLYYNAIKLATALGGSFIQNDAIDSWLVKVSQDGSFSMVSYKSLTSPEAPAANSLCLGTFNTAQLPWPPSSSAIPGSLTCGTQRAGLNIAPAIAPDGTIYSVTRSHFTGRYSFLVAIAPDLSKKWVASLRDRFHDGCGVSVDAGGWLPPNGDLGGCRTGAQLGVDPATNRPGDGMVDDSSSSTPTITPSGTILYGAYTRYNYSQGHLMQFDANGSYLGAFGFGWDYTPAIYSHDGTWSVVVKNNHYDIGSYCNNAAFCPLDRTATNPASPEAYYVSQLNSNLVLEWSFQSTNTKSCQRNSDGTLSCVSDHPSGFEWCVNAPVIDVGGVVYANSEDGNLYAIGQGGVQKQTIFQQLAIGAAYTPASLGGDGKIYTQNFGHLFVVGK
jgi:uncharacterized protein (TIGR03437 family)